DPAQAARVLTAWYPHVVVKLGPDGALFANGRPEAIHAPAQVVEQHVDGTGSGDAFSAGFLIPWLDKKPPVEALDSGCRLAARARSLLGAGPALCPGFPVFAVLAAGRGCPGPGGKLGHRPREGASPGPGGRKGDAPGPP